MIRFDETAPDSSIAPAIATHIEKYLAQAQALLPELPNDVVVYLDNQHLIPETGVGGYAAGPSIMRISFDPDFPDKAIQQTDLRATVFHQAYHLVQGHTSVQPTAEYDTALDNAIYEGAAIVFERQYAGSRPAWGEYSGIPEATLREWQSNLAGIPIYQYAASETLWQEWSSDNEISQEKWKSYRVGTKLIDDYIAKTGMDVVELRTMKASAILDNLKPSTSV